MSGAQRDSEVREGGEESVEGVIIQSYIILVENEQDGCSGWGSGGRDVVYLHGDGWNREER